MKSIMFTLLLLTTIAQAASAQTAAPEAELSSVSLLIGHWTSGKGQVADTGGTSSGSSTITLEANGSALLRRDHTNLFDASGKAAGGFNQIMLIYPEDGTLHADYSDGTHVIHYASAVIKPNQSVSFLSGSRPGVPSFKLSCTLASPDTLAVAFSMAPPGSSPFHPIATGTLTRAK